MKNLENTQAMIDGYRQMAAINLQIAEEFAACEDEAAQIIEKQLKSKNDA